MLLKKAILTLVLASLLQGCMNLYTRCPGTAPIISDTYQCTEMTAGMSFVVMFPQVMMPSGGNKFMFPENLISIPIGCLCFVDVAAEGVLDTVFWPIDWSISKSRKNKRDLTEVEDHESDSGKGR
jgi:uncharacterized protein YceK